MVESNAERCDRDRRCFRFGGVFCPTTCCFSGFERTLPICLYITTGGDLGTEQSAEPTPDEDAQPTPTAEQPDTGDQEQVKPDDQEQPEPERSLPTYSRIYHEPSGSHSRTVLISTTAIKLVPVVTYDR